MKATKWMTIEQPGYLGRHRDEKYQQWDEEYGKNNWRLVWRINYQVDVDLLGVCALYEDAYDVFLMRNEDVLEQLLNEASDIYDDELSNVQSGFDYMKQETKRTHIQDIAIRRCVLRRGKWFRGKELIQIRDVKGTHPLSITLSPGRVPMHNRSWIMQPEAEGWWESGSVESFYQSNRLLQVR